MKNRLIIFSFLSVLTLFAMAFVYAEDYSLDELMGIERPTMVGTEFNLRPEVAQAFLEMQLAAHKDGINLYSLSSYRGFDHQLRIYNTKWNRYKNQGIKGLAIINKIIQYSTIPGTSRHHWGTDLDVIDKNILVKGDKLLPQNYQEGGVYEKLGSWIRANSETHGFYLVYTNTENRKGFKYEPWHLSYKKLSQPILRQYLSQDWQSKLERINGYQFMDTDFLKRYSTENIQDINPDLL